VQNFITMAVREPAVDALTGEIHDELRDVDCPSE
jgi:hypothetical protein